MKKLFLGAYFLYVCASLSAQQVYWQKDVKTQTQDFLSGLSVTLDGQFLASGSSIQSPKMTSASSAGGIGQNNGYDFHLVKLDQRGEEVWEKFFQGQNHDFLTATVSTQEGGFLLAGTSYSPQGLDKKGKAFGGSDIWLIKIAENGNEDWQRTIGTSGNEEARAVVQSTDLGYFVAGSIEDRTTGYGSKDVWLLKLDQKGKPTKEIIIGGQGTDEVEKMIPTADGGALVGIYSRSGNFGNEKLKGSSEKLKNISGKLKTSTSDSEDPRNAPRKEAFFTDESDHTAAISARQGRGNATTASKPVSRKSYPKETENYGEGDYWIIKLDKDGNIEWQKNYGGKEDDHIRTLALTGNGYIIGGESRSEKSGNKNAGVEEGTDVWLVALDKNGNEVFQKSYTFGNRDVLMSINTIWDRNGKESKGYLLGGYTQAEGKIEQNDETFWMLYLNNQGEEVWRKHIEGESRKKEERLISAQMLNDGTYVLAGTSAKELGKENWKIVKLGDQQVQDLVEKQNIRIYPNPVQEYCYIEIGYDFKDATIDIYYMGGRHLQSTATRNRVTKINTQPLIQGAYLVVAKVQTENETKTVNAKLIKK